MSNIISFPIETNKTREAIKQALTSALNNYPGGSNAYFTMLRDEYPKEFWELFVKALYCKSLREAK
jgi:hypothetical protein